MDVPLRRIEHPFDEGEGRGFESRHEFIFYFLA